MLTVKECKALARETLLGRYGVAILAAIVTTVIPIMFSGITFSAIGFLFVKSGILNSLLDVSFLFSFPLLMLGVMLAVLALAALIIMTEFFAIGRKKLFLNICRGRRYSISDIFYAFHIGSHAWRVIAIELILWAISSAIHWIPKGLEMIIPVLLGRPHFGWAISAVISLLCILVSVLVVMRFMFASLIVIDKPETSISRALSLSNEMMYGRTLKGFWLLTFSFLFWNILMLVCNVTAFWIIPYMECTKIIFYMDADDSVWQVPGAKRKGTANAPSADFPGANPAAGETDEANDNIDDSAENSAEESAEMVTEEAMAETFSEMQPAENPAENPEENPAEKPAPAPQDSWEKLVSDMNINIPHNNDRQETDL